MNKIPAYNANIPRKYYSSFGENEWTRLSNDCPGRLLYHVHMDVFRCYIKKEDSVLGLGAGAGVFSKELVKLAGNLVVYGIPEEQLAINKSKMKMLGLQEFFHLQGKQP